VEPEKGLEPLACSFESGRNVTAMAMTLGRSAKHISARLALLELVGCQYLVMWLTWAFWVRQHRVRP
jgi:hypothetical protein